MPTELELLLPVWAYVISETTFWIAVVVEIGGVIGLAFMGLLRRWRIGDLHPSGTALVILALSSMIVPLLNLGLNVLVWIAHGDTQRGAGAPFW